MNVPPPTDEYFLDPLLVRRAFDRASATFDGFAGVHGELRTRLLDRLDVVRLDPAVVVDLGAGTGHGARALQDRYRSAHVLAVDLSVRMLQQARRQQRLFKRFARAAADAHQLGLKSGSVDLLFSNLMLQWCADPDRVFSEMARVLKAEGLLMFTTLGPDTLRELRAAWGEEAIHVHRFVDMHDLGDALMRAGFAEPVMDTERLTVTYADFTAFTRELRATGSTNIALGRARALQTRRKFNQARSSYPLLRDSRVPVTLEVVYGHAWSVGPRANRSASGDVVIPLNSIGRRHR